MLRRWRYLHFSLREARLSGEAGLPKFTLFSFGFPLAKSGFRITDSAKGISFYAQRQGFRTGREFLNCC